MAKSDMKPLVPLTTAAREDEDPSCRLQRWIAYGKIEVVRIGPPLLRPTRLSDPLLIVLNS
jgi:hypothetical protein